MSAERLSEKEFHRREALGQALSGGGEIALNVNAGREEVWHQDHALSPLIHASRRSRLNSGWGQFQERRFDDGELPAPADLYGQDVEVIVGLELAAPMGNKQKGGLHANLIGRVTQKLIPPPFYGAGAAARI